MRYYETKRDCIDLFRDEYEFLSNFYPARLRFEGVTFNNAEAAYQAQKCEDEEERKRFTQLSADEAKRLGREIQIRQDWEQKKLSVMDAVVRAKFLQNPHLAQYLAETENTELIEGNGWNDTYWGVDLRSGTGDNNLGKILMALRQEFQQKGIPEAVVKPEKLIFGPICSISVEVGDITQSECECIVNAADKSLIPGGGMERAIHRAAGPELLEACKMLNGCRTGEAKITKGYQLKAGYVIHAVGPHYGERNDEELLIQSYYNTMELAKDNDLHSIAFPAISAGKASYPKKQAAKIAVDTIKYWLDQNQDYQIQAVFVLTDITLYEYFCMYLKCNA